MSKLLGDLIPASVLARGVRGLTRRETEAAIEELKASGAAEEVWLAGQKYYRLNYAAFLAGEPPDG